MARRTENQVAGLIRLLETFGGVRIEDSHVSKTGTHLALRIADANSVARLAYFTVAANVRLNVYGDSLPTEDEDPSQSLVRLVWQLTFAIDDTDFEPAPRQLPEFAAFLIRDLVASGRLIGSDEATARSLFDQAN